MRFPAAKDIHVDIDSFVNRVVPPSQLHRLPAPISWFLGYRATPRPDVGNVLIWIWSFVGAFCGLALVAGIFQASSAIQSLHPPLVFASLGATAILDYNTIQSPLAQPRNSILGHALSAVVGVAVTELFMLNQNFEDLRWVAGAVACGVASAVMGITNTVHPPGGATALLFAIDTQATGLGWMYIPLVILGATLMLVVACLLNNIQRQFPAYWWTSADVGATSERNIERSPGVKEGSTNRMSKVFSEGSYGIMVTAGHVIIPQGFDLAWEEKEILELLRDRLREVSDS